MRSALLPREPINHLSTYPFIRMNLSNGTIPCHLLDDSGCPLGDNVCRSCRFPAPSRTPERFQNGSQCRAWNHQPYSAQSADPPALIGPRHGPPSPKPPQAWTPQPSSAQSMESPALICPGRGPPPRTWSMAGHSPRTRDYSTSGPILPRATVDEEMNTPGR